VKLQTYQEKIIKCEKSQPISQTLRIEKVFLQKVSELAWFGHHRKKEYLYCLSSRICGEIANVNLPGKRG